MNLKKEIYTLNARENVIFDLAFKDTDSDKVFSEINRFFELFISSLSENKISYSNLKNCLIPRKNKHEIAFIFDSTKTNSNYSILALSKLLPLLNNKSSHSILIGDYTGENKNRYKLLKLFKEHINQINPTDYQYHNQYFLVYINNISDEMTTRIIRELKPYDFFIGYFDMTYSSILKTYISGILTHHLIKDKSTIILKDPYETSIIENLKENKYCDYEELGFNCKFVHSMFYEVFLSYKIERRVLESFKNDSKYSLNSLSPSIVGLEDCKIEIEQSKFKHILSEKKTNIERAGINKLSIAELENLIKRKISNNYIYNLTFLENYNTLKFNILLEVARVDSDKLMKLIVALEYKPKEKILRLITLF